VEPIGFIKALIAKEKLIKAAPHPTPDVAPAAPAIIKPAPVKKVAK
jgi:hypothetical protein